MKERYSDFVRICLFVSEDCCMHVNLMQGKLALSLGIDLRFSRPRSVVRRPIDSTAGSVQSPSVCLSVCAQKSYQGCVCGGGGVETQHWDFNTTMFNTTT